MKKDEQNSNIGLVIGYEAASISDKNSKFVYYDNAKKDDQTGKVPKEYQGHLAFEAKHIEGLSDHGP